MRGASPARAFLCALLLAGAAQAFVGDARVEYTAAQAAEALADDSWSVLDSDEASWQQQQQQGAGGPYAAAKERAAYITAAARRRRNQQQPQQPKDGAAADQQQHQQRRPPSLNDGGGAFTCKDFDPGRDAIPANATLIRRLSVKTPQRLPKQFTSVSQPSSTEIIEFAAPLIGVPASGLRLVQEHAEADRIDSLGMRHVRLEQVANYTGDLYGVEYGGIVVHLRQGPEGPELYFLTGGVVDDIDGRLAIGEKHRTEKARSDADSAGPRGSYGLIDGPAATAIGVNAALGGGSSDGRKDRRQAASSRRARRAAARAAAAAAVARSPEIEAAAADGRPEPAGARDDPRRVLYCDAAGGCHPTWRQPVFVPASYTSSKSPQEVHVYVSAADGVVIAQHDRLRTYARDAEAAGGLDSDDSAGFSDYADRRRRGRNAAAATAASPGVVAWGPAAPGDGGSPPPVGIGFGQGIPEAGPAPGSNGAATAPPASYPSLTANDSRAGNATASVPSLLPASAYAKPRSNTPAARAAAEAINSALRSRYDGPGMTATRGVGQTLYQGRVNLDTAQVARITRRGTRVGGAYVLTDLRRLGQKTYDLMGRDDPAKSGADKGDLVSDRRNVWGNGLPNDRKTASADAHWGMGVVFDYYNQRHGRLGVDGKGTPIFGRTHLGRAMDDAYWTANHVTYGDGSRDPRQLFTSCKGLPPLVTLDITGHEISHGVIENSAQLAYSYSFGALNEATADIMSVCIQDFAHTTGASSKPASFFPGTQMFPPTCPQPWIRSMVNPAADGKSWSCWHPSFDATWRPRPRPSSPSSSSTPGSTSSAPGAAASDCPQGGAPGYASAGDAPGGSSGGSGTGPQKYCFVDVHWSSGPANRAFWLMSKGLSCGGAGARQVPPPIGIRKSCDIWYRALTSYFSPITDYYEARASTVRAAQDLFPGSPEEATAVKAAWDIVGAPDEPNGFGPRCDAGFAVDQQSCPAAR